MQRIANPCTPVRFRVAPPVFSMPQDALCPGAFLFWAYTMHIHPDHRNDILPYLVVVVGLGLFALGALLLPLGNLQLSVNDNRWLHVILGTITIGLGTATFAIGWSAPKEHVSQANSVLACAFLIMALLGLVHTLTALSMVRMNDHDPNNTFLVFMVSRAVGALALLWVGNPNRHILPTIHRTTLLISAIMLVVLSCIAARYAPEWFARQVPSAETRVQLQKIYEYVLLIMYLAAAWRLARQTHYRRTFHASGLAATAVVFAMSELLFAYASTGTRIYYVLGHLYNATAFIIIFRVLFLETVKAPYAQLHQSRIELQRLLGKLSSALSEKEEQSSLIEKLSLAIEQSPNPILITDRWGKIEYVNQAFTASCGYELHEIIGRNPRFLQSGRTPYATYKDMWEHLSKGKAWQGEVVNRTKTGEDYSERTLIYPIKNKEGEITSFLSHKEDITAQKAADARIRQLSHFDPLTGLANQSTLRAMLRHALDLASHHNDSLAVMSINLDNFRLINESLGHGMGDLILKAAAARLLSKVDNKDTVARVSGDHFVLLFPGRDQGAATLKALDIVQTMQQPLNIEGHSAIITVSIGIAMFPDDGVTPEVLLACSEAAMYHTKNEGRNGYRFFTPGLQKSSARMLELGVSLKQAIPNGELRLVYQPQVDLTTGKVTGAEALVRWRHPTLGEIGPAEFIPIAEQYGLIVDLGEWIMKTALQQATLWQHSGYDDLVIAINLSASQFNQPRLAETIMAIVSETGAQPHQLELELTEAVAMRNPVAAGQIMDSLSALGFRLSIDDFGTGYSSLSYLKRFNIHKLKIDRSFIIDLKDNVNDQAIVTAIIQMAHSLGMTTLAEGVETEDQLAVLKARGCNAVQGYLYSKPLSPEDFERYIQTHYG